MVGSLPVNSTERLALDILDTLATQWLALYNGMAEEAGSWHTGYFGHTMVGFSAGNGRKGWLLTYWILWPHNVWLFTREWQKRMALGILDTSATQWLAFHQGMAEKAGSWHTGYFGHTMVGFSAGNGRKGWLLAYWILWPHSRACS